MQIVLKRSWEPCADILTGAVAELKYLLQCLRINCVDDYDIWSAVEHVTTQCYEK